MTAIITPENAHHYLRQHEVAYLRQLAAHIKPPRLRGAVPYLQAELRAYLQRHREGKTIKEIALETGRAENTVRNALKRMDDAWVERLIWNGAGKQAVWRVVPPLPERHKPKAFYG
jgi:hypothetical protein